MNAVAQPLQEALMASRFFQAPGLNRLNQLRFLSAGTLVAVPAAQTAQEWVHQALEGARLKPEYADLSISGLLLLRDTIGARAG